MVLEGWRNVVFVFFRLYPLQLLLPELTRRGRY